MRGLRIAASFAPTGAGSYPQPRHPTARAMGYHLPPLPGLGTPRWLPDPTARAVGYYLTPLPGLGTSRVAASLGSRRGLGLNAPAGAEVRRLSDASTNNFAAGVAGC